jgi:ligand-binding SRPBCC domain-containing protein
MRYTFHSERWFPCRIDLAFAFFANPHNLPRLMPSWQDARIELAAFAPPPPRPIACDLSPHETIAAGVGSRINVSFRPFPYAPFRISWEAEIVEFTWNEHLCDVQIRGPFTFWRHHHRLQRETHTDESGAPLEGTLLHDDIEYSLPLGPIGALTQRLIIEPQLKATFQHRHERTRELLKLLYDSR